MLAGVAPPEPEKVRVALAGQAMSNIAIVTCPVWPGARVPLDGLKLIPLNWFALQVSVP